MRKKVELLNNHFEVELIAMEFLRDSAWQFWGVVISVVTALITISIFLLQRKNKRLTYTVLTETPLLSVDDEIKGKIKIKYGRKNIQNIHLVLLKIQNQGNVDIASSDYEKPIIFSFEDSEILSIEAVDVSPKNLKPTITNVLSKFTIEPILLNKKDYIVIKLLFSNYGSKIAVDTRILGVKEIQRFDRNYDLPRWPRIMIEAFAALILAFVILRFTPRTPSPLLLLVLVVLEVLVIGLLYLVIRSDRKKA